MKKHAQLLIEGTETINEKIFVNANNISKYVSCWEKGASVEDTCTN
jgi:hypothetical protein